MYVPGRRDGREDGLYPLLHLQTRRDDLPIRQTPD